MAAETVELHKLKLAELKQECLAHGMETKGIKQDLINRLQAYLEEHAEEEANEEDILGDETEEVEPKPVHRNAKEEEPSEKTVDVAAENKVVKSTSEMPQTERMQKRAERFNVLVSLESKKATRTVRFGISPVSTKGLSPHIKPMVNLDKLKERAQIFDLNVSSISRKSEEDEELKKKKERFGIVPSSTGTGTTKGTEAKKRKRAENFEIAGDVKMGTGGVLFVTPSKPSFSKCGYFATEAGACQSVLSECGHAGRCEREPRTAVGWPVTPRDEDARPCRRAQAATPAAGSAGGRFRLEGSAAGPSVSFSGALVFPRPTGSGEGFCQPIGGKISGCVRISALGASHSRPTPANRVAFNRLIIDSNARFMS
ncbi:LOW QUALITY PROTEIN: uncharacterized protein ACDL77_013606 [Rhynchocyon petersi]